MLKQHLEKCKQHSLCQATCFYYEATFFNVETNFSIFKRLKKNRKKLKKKKIFSNYIFNVGDSVFKYLSNMLG